MNEPSNDIERLFQAIANVTPSPEATTQALARARATLAPRKPRKRWLWPVSIAATLLIAAGLALPLMLPRPVSAQQALAATLKATAAYKGWVHVTFAGGNLVPGDSVLVAEAFGSGNPLGDWNTVSGDFVLLRGANNVYFMKPRSGEIEQYIAPINTLYIGSLNPARIGRMQDTVESLPLNFSELIDKMQTTVGQANVHVTQRTDRGMDRFDIAFPPAAMHTEKDQWLDVQWPYPPTTVWVDPKTKRIAEITANNKQYQLSYGPPEYPDIYAAGVPRDAKIVDNRASHETLAALERVTRRVTQDFPDGLLVALIQRGNDLKAGNPVLRVYFRSGAQLGMRFYPVTVGPAEDGKVQWVENPKDAADIPAQLARVLPDWEWANDGQRAWQRYFNRKTGAVWHTEWTHDSPTHSYSETKPGELVLDAADSRVPLERSFFHMSTLYPDTLDPQLMAATRRLELITSPDRPGLTAFRQRNMLSATRVREEWFDPAHNDRAVESIATDYHDDQMRDVRSRTVKQSGDYATLPDGRTFPTTIQITYYEPDAKGNLAPTDRPEPNVLSWTPGKATLRFFPGAQLPEIPQPPASQPTPAATMHSP